MNDIQLSAVVEAIPVKSGGHFCVRRLGLDSLGRLGRPVLLLDHYTMFGKTFSPKPHAGYTRVSYILESSPGGLRCRDSLENELMLEPGDLLWSQASSGLIHDELPAHIGKAVEGLQIYVNMSSSNKRLPPKVTKIQAGNVPTIRDANGNAIKVLCGHYQTISSTVEQAEQFDILDVAISHVFKYKPRPETNFLIYILSGDTQIQCKNVERNLTSHTAIAGTLGKRTEYINITSQCGSRLLIMSGTDANEPITSYGTFIMNTESEIVDAFERYRNGEMGRLRIGGNWN